MIYVDDIFGIRKVNLYDEGWGLKKDQQKGMEQVTRAPCSFSHHYVALLNTHNNTASMHKD